MAGPKIAIRYKPADGDPASQILNIAAEGKADLIVVGPDGRGFFGSLRAASRRKSWGPVLTVRGQARAEDAERREPQVFAR